jgi:hypothetical protein
VSLNIRLQGRKRKQHEELVLAIRFARTSCGGADPTYGLGNLFQLSNVNSLSPPCCNCVASDASSSQTTTGRFAPQAVNPEPLIARMVLGAPNLKAGNQVSEFEFFKLKPSCGSRMPGRLRAGGRRHHPLN